MNKVPAITILLTLICFSRLNAQVYYLNNGFTNGGSAKTCNGFFKDSNPVGDYTGNERYTVTFVTENNNIQAMQLDFDTLDIAKGDTLFIYDGTSVNAPLLLTLSNIDGAPISVRATANNPSGTLTAQFTSNNVEFGRGWNAAISCKSPCQKILVNLITSPAPGPDGFINICNGSEVTFTGNGIYGQNNTFYKQSDSTAKFLWTFSDGRDTTGIFAKTIKRRFTQEGGTVVQLAIMDQNECYNLTATQVKIRTSITPSFNIQQKTICIFDTARLVAKLTYPQAIFSNLPVFSDKKPLADGVGKCYETSINITKFLPGQKLTSLNDLDGILINMEHSWLGDITIAITAPNGTKVFLKKSVGTTLGWETFLGEPVKEPNLTSNLSSVPGKGYDYLFSPKPTFSTMANEKGRYLYSYLDNAGQSITNHTFLPAGSYASEDSLSALIGTTLNGLWTIEVCDNFKEDNGFIFYWTLKLKPAVYPNSEVYTNIIASQLWENAPGLITAKDSTAIISPTIPGNYAYKYIATDNFGCKVDTTVQVRVNALPDKPLLGPDAELCAGQPLTLRVSNPQADIQYSWNNFTNGLTSLVVSTTGNYVVTAQNINTCKITDTIVVKNGPPLAVSLGSDTMFCASSPLLISPKFTGNLSSFMWNTGATTTDLITTGAGIYSLTATTVAGCIVSDTIVLTDNPANRVRLPRDTTICQGTTIQVRVNNAIPNSDIRWNDGSIAITRLLPVGNYGIETSFAGCTLTSQQTITAKPIPIVRLGIDTSLCIGFELPLSVNYAGATFLWSTGSTAKAIVAKNAGLYWVQSTLNGCNFRDSLIMAQRFCSCNVAVPNAFSPNGDGINDLFKPTIDCFPGDFRLSIFDRYGRLLYNSTNYQWVWDGTINGKPLPVATYYYILSFFNIELKQPQQFKGSITLLK